MLKGFWKYFVYNWQLAKYQMMKF